MPPTVEGAATMFSSMRNRLITKARRFPLPIALTGAIIEQCLRTLEIYGSLPIVTNITENIEEGVYDQPEIC